MIGGAAQIAIIKFIKKVLCKISQGENYEYCSR